MVPFPKIAVNLHFSYGKLHSKGKPYQLARSFSSVKKTPYYFILGDKKFKISEGQKPKPPMKRTDSQTEGIGSHHYDWYPGRVDPYVMVVLMQL